jgi:HAMP domain-containing protein
MFTVRVNALLLLQPILVVGDTFVLTFFVCYIRLSTLRMSYAYAYGTCREGESRYCAVKHRKSTVCVERSIGYYKGDMAMLSKLSIQFKYTVVFLITVALIGAGLWKGVEHLKVRQLRNEASAIAEQVVAFRAWISGTGVVWVDHTADGFPDFLGHRAGVDASGKPMDFVSKNPALATRELSEIANKASARVKFRVTSDRYRNLLNSPDGFETIAIKAFKDDKDLKIYERLERGEYRYTEPLYIQKACLKCHGDPKDAPPDVINKYGDSAAFGYKEGDVRGIISVKLPDVPWTEFVLTLLNPYSVGLILLAFVVNYLYAQRAIIRRLAQLAKDTEAIANGNLELSLPVKPGARDEVDHVTNAVDLLRKSVAVAMKRMRHKD